MRVTQIGTTLSPIRLHRFVTAAGGVPQGLRLYRWNVQVSSAYWTPLHFLEVAVRNAVNDAMAETYDSVFWFQDDDRPGEGASWLYDFERDAVTKAFGKFGQDPTAGKIVAELHLGFWAGLLSGRYYDGGTDYHHVVWVRGGVSRKFGGAKRGVVHKRLDRLRRFRNRIAHHEHVLGANLDVLSTDIDAILRMVDPVTAGWVRAMSDVAEVRAARPC